MVVQLPGQMRPCKEGDAAILDGAMHWHQSHVESRTRGERAADVFATVVGSWRFVIGQSIALAVWILLNCVGTIPWQWDVYPFVLLNLVLSFQAAYTGPIVMMSQNRQADRDRHQADFDLETNLAAKLEIEALQVNLARIENEKLDLIIRHLGIG